MKFNLKKTIAAFTILNTIPILLFFAGLADGASVYDALIDGYVSAIVAYVFIAIIVWCMVELSK
jgi:hypothetical protein